MQNGAAPGRCGPFTTIDEAVSQLQVMLLLPDQPEMQLSCCGAVGLAQAATTTEAMARAR